MKEVEVKKIVDGDVMMKKKVTLLPRKSTIVCTRLYSVVTRRFCGNLLVNS